jgi:hypothetical protein
MGGINHQKGGLWYCFTNIQRHPRIPIDLEPLMGQKEGIPWQTMTTSEDAAIADGNPIPSRELQFAMLCV